MPNMYEEFAALQNLAATMNGDYIYWTCIMSVVKSNRKKYKAQFNNFIYRKIV